MSDRIRRTQPTTTRQRRRRFPAPAVRPSAVAAAFVVLGGVGAFAPSARAQYGGGMGMPGGGMPSPPPGGGQGGGTKEEGPAEQAPEEETRPSDLEPLTGYTDQSKRRTQIFGMDGYFRLRTDYMHDFFLGQGYTSRAPQVGGAAMATGQNNYGLPPFPTPLDCPNPITDLATAKGNCGHRDMAAANIRLRLEPTLNVTDNVRVRAQIDVLDNTILGSTPDSLAGMQRGPIDRVPQAPVPFLYTTQDPPEVGQNGFSSSIRAKRAWAEIDTEYGSLRFGRMPWHFGRGMSFNDGSCLDCDGGTTVDRIAALTEVFGHQITAAFDFGSQGLTSGQVALGQSNPSGYPIDFGQDDDVFEYMLSITRIDNPIRLRERVDRGDVVLNYGVQAVYRTQQMAPAYENCANTGTCTLPTPSMPATKETAVPTETVNAMLIQPNVWAKLYYKGLTLEFEGTGVFGKMDNGGILVDQQEQGHRVTFRQFGWVAAGELRLYRDTFLIGLETGGATGDQAEDPSQYLNYRYRFVRQPPGDTSINDFKFSPEYHIDSILFRHIIGTVTNAIYVKPTLTYWFDLLQGRQLGLTGSFIYSIAQIPVSTPGNSINYGVEMNLGATYRNTPEGFYAGMTWGVLWPLGALDRPADVWGTDAADAKAAQVLRGFLGVKF